MATRDPNQAAADWASRLSQSGDKIARGIDAVQTAPGQLAAAQSEVWAANTIGAKDKWKRNTASVGLQEWKDAAKNKGVPRIAQGATAAEGKMATFLGELFPHIDRVKGTLKPRGNLEQNIARSADFARGMAQFRRTR
jgi:hypothetical protein